MRDIDGSAIGGLRQADSLVVTMINLAANQWTAYLSAIAVFAETVVDHRYACKTIRHTVMIDRTNNGSDPFLVYCANRA